MIRILKLSPTTNVLIKECVCAAIYIFLNSKTDSITTTVNFYRNINVPKYLNLRNFDGDCDVGGVYLPTDKK